MGRKSKQRRQVLAQQRALSKSSAEQESFSSAFDSELKGASFSDEKVMIIEVKLNAF